MSRYCFDTSAWVEYFDDTQCAEKIEQILTDPQNEIFSSIITAAELASVFNRRGKNGREAVELLMELSIIVDLHDISTVIEAAELHRKQRALHKTFGMGDAIIFASAKAMDAILVTTDSHFKGLKGVLLFE